MEEWVGRNGGEKREKLGIQGFKNINGGEEVLR